MSETEEGGIVRVKVVNAPKVADFEERLNQVLAKIPADQLVGVEYLYDPETYGFTGIIQYMVYPE